MAKASKAREPAEPVARSELFEVVRETIRTASGLAGSELKKKLPKPYQPHHVDALALARELAATGEIHRWVKGKTERFFSSDPLEALERTALGILERGPATQATLKREIEEAAPALLPLFADWWKSAVASSRIFEQLGGAAKTKLFGTRPDIRILKKQLEALRKALTAFEGKGIGKRDVASAVLDMLGLAPALLGDAEASNRDVDRAAFLDALRELAHQNPYGALLPVRELRAAVRWPKERFDRAALLLAEEGAVTLHYHDHAASLPASERAELVEDARGTHYMGIAFRRST